MRQAYSTNANRRTHRRGLLLAAWLIVAPGCAGMSHTDPRAAWVEPNRPSASATPAPTSAPAPASTPASSPAGAAVSIRGQGGWDANDELPGEEAHLRYPMRPSGQSPATVPAQVTNPAPAVTTLQPPAATTAPGPGAVASPVTATMSDNYSWLNSPFLNNTAEGVLPPMEQLPGTPVPVDVLVEEARTGRFMFGAGVNSDAGVTGQITVDERNFDLFGFPRSWSDLWNGEAWRGAGQGFRLEAMPGNRVQRYLVSFTEPYLLGTHVSLTTSGYLFDRGYYDWDENRVGGRLGLGYRLTPDLSVSASLRMEDVDISSPRVLGLPALDSVLGSNDLYSARYTLRHDTRDMPFLPTEGHLIELSFEHAFGEYDYPRGEIDYRRYFLIRERPDGSGRHVLAASLGAGVTGPDTPIFENYFAGGFTTLRGFDFRGASPVDHTVTVGGRFRLLGSFEYMLPLTADDMIRAVAFVDYGTVEEDVRINWDNFRVAPGFGFRISVPALGPAPLAFDFAFPVCMADTDDEQVFSFFVGFGRG